MKWKSQCVVHEIMPLSEHDSSLCCIRVCHVAQDAIVILVVSEEIGVYDLQRF